MTQLEMKFERSAVILEEYHALWAGFSLKFHFIRQAFLQTVPLLCNVACTYSKGFS